MKLSDNRNGIKSRTSMKLENINLANHCPKRLRANHPTPTLENLSVVKLSVTGDGFALSTG